MRRKIITLHLLLAAFMAPAFIMVAVSGGLYLLGIQGSETETHITVPHKGTPGVDIVIDENRNPADLESEVRALLDQLDLDIDFEYLRVRGTTLVTRPTSRQHILIRYTEDGLEVVKRSPDLQSSMMELHKGHGPALFKTYQKWVAVGLIFVMLSGLWMGLSNKALRLRTFASLGIGLVTFVVLVLF